MAQNNLGVCYQTGEGVEKNYAEAVKWYRKAADQNDALAQVNLAGCYAQGIGVTKDLSEAYAWLSLAALTDPSLSKQRDALAQLMTAEQILAGARRLQALRTQLDRARTKRTGHSRPQRP